MSVLWIIIICILAMQYTIFLLLLSADQISYKRTFLLYVIPFGICVLIWESICNFYKKLK